ncbi:hypothetical protein FGO68_gene8938 [Halteria grandinella]|uniref:Uncharacterized protein n=1 Tax=Halteria grandinella TaxID=5974 RepID=A0A8J8NSW2_HALGN|nr:hypothetical protein FGO68_gene8938 [Halteria grandinella]
MASTTRIGIKIIAPGQNFHFFHCGASYLRKAGYLESRSSRTLRTEWICDQDISKRARPIRAQRLHQKIAWMYQLSIIIKLCFQGSIIIKLIYKSRLKCLLTQYYLS